MKVLNHNTFVVGLFVVLVVLASNTLVLAFPPDPDNAALLYYQAFLLRKQPDETMKQMLTDLSRGEIPVDKRIAEYVESNRRAIDLAIAAADMPFCDWGLKYSDGWSAEIPYLWQVRELVRLVLADARILADRGDYESALDRCVTVRKLGWHGTADTPLISYIVALKIEELANNCIQHILPSTPPDQQTVQSLRLRLNELDSRSIPLKVPVHHEHEQIARYMTVEKVGEIIPLLEGFVFAEDKANVSIARDRILAADERFCRMNRDYFDKHAAAVIAALDLPYAQAYGKLKDLGDSPRREFEKNPEATLAAVLAPSLDNAYNCQVHRTTYSNALKAAVELYIIAARTSQLPDALPAGLPRDMFSGEDFEYQKKADGFILRCRGRDLKEDKIHEYEFKVKK
ncbi:MAG TPA: hypothetical protein VMW16_09830 [Sedimentisphaerales bacterium]|nr:hypothetical protein [Sedimentisphaerales bacterium]